MIPQYLPHILQQHVDELVILMRQRNRLLVIPEAYLSDLAELDARIDAHLAGLRLAGDVGWELAYQGFDNIPDASSVFATMHLAVTKDTAARTTKVLEAISADMKLARPAALALAWFGRDYAQAAAQAMLQDAGLAQNMVGLHLCDIVGYYSAELMAPFLSGRVQLRPLTCWLVGMGGLTELESRLNTVHPDDDDATQEGKAVARALVSRERTLPQDLLAQAGLDAVLDEIALCIVALKATEEDWESYLGNRDVTTTPAMIAAAGHRADPALVPWLLDQDLNAPDTNEAGIALRRLLGMSPDTLLAKREEYMAKPDPFGLGTGDTFLSDKEWMQSWWSTQAFTGQAIVCGKVPTEDNHKVLCDNAPLPDRRYLQVRARLLYARCPTAAVDAPAAIQKATNS